MVLAKKAKLEDGDCAIERLAEPGIGSLSAEAALALLLSCPSRVMMRRDERWSSSASDVMLK